MEVRDPRGSEDECFMVCIRRANLDAMAAKSPLTIIAHLRETMTVVNNASLINKTPSYHPKSPFPMADSPTFWRQQLCFLRCDDISDEDSTMCLLDGGDR